MLLASPAKINIGLLITARRSDGFHELQTLMWPAGLCDLIEIMTAPHGSPALEFTRSGIALDELPGNNLCEKAHRLFTKETNLPPLKIHLHKQIPVGAGLGGGSSNASTVLRGLNKLADSALTEAKLHELAAALGSDCPFFLHDGAMIAEGRGDILRPASIRLEDLFLVLLFPDIHSSTAEAYAGIRPVIPERPLEEVLQENIGSWKGAVKNDFEQSIFKRYPELAALKSQLYDAGAVYASLSGSGSSLYGIFREKPGLDRRLKEKRIWQGPLYSPPPL